MVLAIQFILTALMGVVVVLDATRYLIPNWLNMLLLLFFVATSALVYPAMDFSGPLIAFGVLLAVGFVAFSFNIVGGGDVKLLAVSGLYMGWGMLLVKFTVYMALLGGLLSLVLVAGRWLAPMIGSKVGVSGIPRMFTQGEPVPYGLAIAGAFLIILWGEGLPFLD